MHEIREGRIHRLKAPSAKRVFARSPEFFSFVFRREFGRYQICGLVYEQKSALALGRARPRWSRCAVAGPPPGNNRILDHTRCADHQPPLRPVPRLRSGRRPCSFRTTSFRAGRRESSWPNAQKPPAQQPRQPAYLSTMPATQCGRGKARPTRSASSALPWAWLPRSLPRRSIGVGYGGVASTCVSVASTRRVAPNDSTPLFPDRSAPQRLRTQVTFVFGLDSE